MLFLTRVLAPPAAARRLVVASLVVASGVAVGVVSAEGEPAADAGAAWGAGEIVKSKAPAEGAPLLMIQPRSLSPEVSVLVEDARKTVFSAGYQGRLGARGYSRDSFRAAHPEGWKHFYRNGVRAAAEHLKSLKPKLVRDKNKVVEYALIQSDHPLTPTTVLAPGFAEMFTESLGEQLLIVIPDRTTIIVFPKLGGTLERHRRGLSDLYDDAIYPVSEEVFELTKDGIRVVGAFRDD